MELLYIDLFCGAGGTSTGVEKAEINGQQCAKVIACVNHDENAIASHTANHPETLHFTEDIRTLDLTSLVKHVNKMKVFYPDALIVLWASLECTNFSRAKGGLPRDGDSRTLAEHLFRYIEMIDPDYLQIENVEEFMSWGDLDENGKPVSSDRGRSYLRWIKKVMKYGYRFEHRILNSANYGAYTSRKRFFGQFAKIGLPISWPEPTHSKTGNKSLFDDLKKWKPVKDKIDFDIEGMSIFTRKIPLCEKTLERIHAGLIKFVANGKDDFLSLYYSGDPKNKNRSLDEPSGAITTKDHHLLIHTDFISAYYGNGHNCTSIDKPSPTIRTKDCLALISPHFIDQYFGTSKPASIEKPLGTILTKDKYSLVTCTPWIMDTNFKNVGSSIEEPSRVITANRKWHYLMNPQYMNSGSSVDKPCFTLIARMDKMPPYLVETESGTIQVRINETNSKFMRLIKEFMNNHSIIDIKMRMLNISELKQIMGFPKDYVLIGTQAEQKKYIGNAVEVTMAKVLCEAVCRKLIKQRKVAV